MLKSIHHISSLDIEATDGKIGKVQNLLFDDQNWKVRYFVVHTGNWLPGKKVLLIPTCLGKPMEQQQILPIQLSKEQIKHSPDLDSHMPVSRQKEIEYHQYYGWTPYWSIGYGIEAPTIPLEAKAHHNIALQEENPHLRSTREVLNYRIHAQDGQIGHVEDFIVDDEKWIIRYLVVNTRNWLPAKKVLISPHWVQIINWEESAVVLDLTHNQVKGSPEYDPRTMINRELEIRLYDYYGRPQNWG